MVSTSSVGSGAVVGLVGPNGAGKTTLLKIISTLLQPTTGHVLVDGYDPSHDARAVRDRIGLVLADDRALYWRLTGRENLEFFGVMHGLTSRDARARAGVLLDQVGLASRDKLVFGYSSGMRARLSLARALLARPPLLLLDEPTRALDPIASAAVAGMIRGPGRRGHRGVAVEPSSRRDRTGMRPDRRGDRRLGAFRGNGRRTSREMAGSRAPSASSSRRSPIHRSTRSMDWATVRPTSTTMMESGPIGARCEHGAGVEHGPPRCDREPRLAHRQALSVSPVAAAAQLRLRRDPRVLRRATLRHRAR